MDVCHILAQPIYDLNKLLNNIHLTLKDFKHFSRVAYIMNHK